MLIHAVLALSPAAAAGVVGAFVLGGTVKGALGVGIPLVAVPLTAQFLDLPAVIGLLSVPMFASNITQVLESGGNVGAVCRLWPMLIAIASGAWLGVHFLISVDRHVLGAIVGPILVLLAGWMLAQPRLVIGPSTERWAGPAVGLVAGVFGGISGMFGPPMIAYLVGLRLRPDLFVKYIALLFLVATGTLILALGGTGSLSPADFAMSAAGMIPIQCGILIGRWLRRRCPAALFRALVLTVLVLGGLDMLRRAVL